MPPTLVSQASYKRVPIPLPKKTRGRARKSKGRKMTRRRRGGMFGMNSGLSQAEKAAIAKRSTYGNTPDYAIDDVKRFGTEEEQKTGDRNRQLLTGFTQGNLRKNILAKTGRRA